MTTYAYDAGTHHLVAIWDTGIGATAQTVARLHVRTSETVAMNLAEALTRMSSSVWLSYTSPELVDLPVAAARRALRRPNLPQGDLLRVDEHPVVESAHRVGRELREVGSAGVSRAVIADVEQEMAAAEDAGRGDLSGRARQAVVLTRVCPRPCRSRWPTGCCTRYRWAARGSSRRSSRPQRASRRSTGSWRLSPSWRGTPT